MASDKASAADVCPVDHKARQAWLDKARTKSPSTAPPAPHPLPSSAQQHRGQPPPPPSHFSLDQSREISTIPRAALLPTDTAPRTSSSSTHPVANAELDTGASASGNWIYPSEKMFFDAMKRKQHNPRAEDMRSIVPIHNAVNERAWAEIKVWEAGRGGGERCGGPKLVSFSGDSSKLTPRARWNSLLGYTAPFDRHDWVVDRCGTRVDYVIDFYEGRQQRGGGGGAPKGLNFYLDVRPKLNSLEGWKMRFWRFWGF